MNKREIEAFVSKKLRGKIEPLISECIAEVNAQGHTFEVFDQSLLEWREPNSNKALIVTCSIGVQCREQAPPAVEPDQIVDAFIKRVESGLDRDAEHLNLLEGDINNGGFFQLLDNKGIKFMKTGATLLKKVGSKQTLKLVSEAIAVIENNNQTIKNYEKLRKNLLRLDSKFYKLKESIAVLYEKFKKTRS